MISVTETAQNKIKELRAAMEVPRDYLLRVGMKGSGCGSSMGFMIGFDKIRPEDKTYIVEDLKILVDKRHDMYVMGMVVDYQFRDGLEGFTFDSPIQQS